MRIFNNYVKYQVKQEMEEDQIIQQLQIYDNQSLKRCVNVHFQYDVTQDEFKTISTILIDKKYFDNQTQISDSIRNQENKILEFFYFSYIFDPAICKYLKQIIESNKQFNFMRNTLFKRIYRMENIDRDEIKRYPHLVISFYQRYGKKRNYRDYMQRILNDCEEWVDFFKDNKRLLDMVVNKKEYILDKESIGMLERYMENENLYMLGRLEFKNMYSCIIDMMTKDPEFVNQLIEAMDEHSVLKTKFIQQQQNFNFHYIKQNSKKHSIFPLIDSKSAHQQIGLMNFNIIQFRLETNHIMHKLNTIDVNKKENVLAVLSQLVFGQIKRGESLQQSLIEPCLQTKKFNNRQLTVKYLQSYLLQRSDSELRLRLLTYMHKVYPIPLVANRIISYESEEKFEKQYFPEISLIMHDGIGIFNFGVGEQGSVRCGKSQLLNNVIYPVSSQTEFLIVNENSMFGVGTVDVFFENICQQKRNLVLMDGQGVQDHLVLQKCIQLTNVMIVHVNYSEIKDTRSQKMKEQFELIYEEKCKNSSSLKLFLIIRDSDKADIVKEYGEQNGDFRDIEYLKQYNQVIDFCIKVPQLNQQRSTDDYESRLRQSCINISYHLNQCLKSLDNIDEYRFNQRNYVEKFMDRNEGQLKLTKLVQKVNQFMKNVDLIRDDITDQWNGLYILQLLNDKKQLMKQFNSIEEVTNSSQQNDLFNKLQSINTQIIEQSQKQPKMVYDFQELMMHQDSIIIQQILQQKLNQFTQENIYESVQLLKNLNMRVVRSTSVIQDALEHQEMVSQLIQEKKREREKIQKQIKQKSISLELLWRCVFYNVQYQNNQNYQKQFYNRMKEKLLKGECLELIDGENLEFKEQVMREIFRTMDKENIFTIAVIGKQSSGKSTLMNFCFGTQFMTSQGRCTSGVYMNLQKLPQRIEHGGKIIDYIMILDTEGLQSPDRYDDEFDRLITTFALANANLIICNSQGDFDSNMKQIIEVSVGCLKHVKVNMVSPQMYFTFGFNRTNNDSKITFLNQLSEMYDNVVKMDPEVRNIAELVKVTEDDIFVLGYAFNNQTIESSEARNIRRDIHIATISNEYCKKTSQLSYQLFKYIEQDIKTCGNSKYKELLTWLDETAKNWRLTNKYATRILQFRNVGEIHDSQLVNVQKQGAFKYIRKQAKIVAKVENIIATDSDKMQIGLGLQSYHEEYKEYIHTVYQQSCKFYFQDWMEQNAKIQKSMIDQANEEVQFQVEVLRQSFVKKLKDESIKLKIGYHYTNGIKAIRNLAIDQVYTNSFRKQYKSYNQTIRSSILDALKNDYDREWQQTLQNIKNEVYQVNNHTFKFQFQKIYNLFKQKQKSIPKLCFELSELDSIYNRVVRLLEQGDEQDEMEIDQKFEINEDFSQIVSNELKERLFQELEDEEVVYVNVKDIFRKVYTYRYINPQKNIDNYKDHISKFLIDILKDIYWINNRRMMNLNNETVHQYTRRKNRLQRLFMFLYSSGYEMTVKKKRYTKVWKYAIQYHFLWDIQDIYRVLKKGDKLNWNDVSFDIYFNELGKYNKQLEGLTKIKYYNSNVKHDLGSQDYYLINGRMNYEIKQIENESESQPDYLFLFDNERYEVVYESIDRNRKNLRNISDIRNCMNQFKEVIDGNGSQLQKKEQLCGFMCKVINWDMFSSRIEVGIKGVLCVSQDDYDNSDDNIMQLCFDEITMTQYNTIYQLIQKEIDVIDRQLSYICGFNLSKEFQGYLAYLGLLVLIKQLIKVQNRNVQQYITQFSNQKHYYWEILQTQVIQQKDIISYNNASKMLENCLNDIRDRCIDANIQELLESFKDDSFKQNYYLDSQQKKLFNKYLVQVNKHKTIEIQQHRNGHSIDKVVLKYKGVLKEYLKSIIQDSKTYLQHLKDSLDTHGYEDINIQDYFQLFKSGSKVSLRGFEIEEKHKISKQLFMLFIDILFCKLDNSLQQDISFVLDRQQY